MQLGYLVQVFVCPGVIIALIAVGNPHALGAKPMTFPRQVSPDGRRRFRFKLELRCVAKRSMQ